VLKAVLFIADRHLSTLLGTMANESNEFAIEATVELSRTGYPLGRALGTTTPDVLLLEITDLERDVPQVTLIRRTIPDVPIVGMVSRELQFLIGGSDLASFAVWPFGAAELEQAISEAVHKFHGGIHENLVAFMPGKAGSGASTVILHTALVIAQELQLRVLVMEGDLAEAPRIDSLSWQRHVATVSGVDFLLTNTAVKEPIPSWTHYFQTLRFAAPKYDLVMVDLPEVVNFATAEVVRRAREIYVVSTPEITSLKLSKQRCQELKNWGVDGQRIRVILNRAHKNDIGPKDAEQILDCPVATIFPNDYKAVRRATIEASLIESGSDLRVAYRGFSKMITGMQDKSSDKKSFMGIFRK
jgi:hypothetical protein